MSYSNSRRAPSTGFPFASRRETCSLFSPIVGGSGSMATCMPRSPAVASVPFPFAQARGAAAARRIIVSVLRVVMSVLLSEAGLGGAEETEVPSYRPLQIREVLFVHNEVGRQIELVHEQV